MARPAFALPAGFAIRGAAEADCTAIADIAAPFTRETVVNWSEGEAEVATAAGMLAKLREARAAGSSGRGDGICHGGAVGAGEGEGEGECDAAEPGAFPWLVLERLADSKGSGGSGGGGGSSASIAGRAAAIVGFAYASPFRTRKGWRFTCENSIYLAPAVQRLGLGRCLLAALITASRNAGLRQMVAAISADGGGAHARGDGLGAASMGLHAALGFAVTGRIASAGQKFGRVMDCVFMQLELRAVDAGAIKRRWEAEVRAGTGSGEGAVGPGGAAARAQESPR